MSGLRMNKDYTIVRPFLNYCENIYLHQAISNLAGRTRTVMISIIKLKHPSNTNKICHPFQKRREDVEDAILISVGEYKALQFIFTHSY